jgi:hypothetical protein
MEMVGIDDEDQIFNEAGFSPDSLLASTFTLARDLPLA